MNASLRLLHWLQDSQRLTLLAGAHNVLGARLAVSAGFDGVWASSFEISTSRGVPDADVLSWQELLEPAAEMARGVDAPVVADCQNGFGGPDLVRRLVSEYESQGIAAVCFEDGACPRRNSLLAGEHELAPLKEFARKIAAAASASREMLVFARLQALIAGRGQAESLARAHAYVDSGADAIVVHSRSPSPAEVLEFVAAWDRPVPLVLIPTTYHSLTTRQMLAAGKIRLAIYANHGLRAALAGMRRVFRQILAEGTSHNAETWIATLDEAFELQKDPAAELVS
jgi:phosphoenolpyruvate phosphomutase